MTARIGQRAGATHRRCPVCRERLLLTGRVDQVTCSPACRTRLYRQRRVARDAFVTPSGSVAPRSGARWSNEPVRHLSQAQVALTYPGQLALWSVGRVRP
jgi:predicted nucleic acid-binding Zn ribbon protein